MNISELAIGKAGEYLVCVDRIMDGMVAFPSEQGLPYDVVVQSGTKMLRVQVKTTQSHRVLPQRKGQFPGYAFNIRRCGAGGWKRYKGDEFDVVAVVALDTRQVGYIHARDLTTCLMVRTEKFRGKYFDEIMDARAETIRKMRADGKSFAAISAEIGTTPSNIAYVTQRRKANKDIGRRGKYLCDMTWKKEWRKR